MEDQPVTSSVVTGKQLGVALQRVQAAHRVDNPTALADAARAYGNLLLCSRTHVVAGHLLGLAAGVAMGRWLP